MLPKPPPEDDKAAFAASVVEVATSRAILLGFLVVALLVVFVLATRLQAPGLLGADQNSTDFDTFYIAGRLAAQGRPTDAYDARMLMLEQRKLTNSVSFMPWTYPPPYLVLVQSLARLPIGVAFAVFVLASFAFYVVVLWRIAGPWLPGVMIGVMPAIVLNLRTGQNGFLMGGAVGLSLLLQATWPIDVREHC